MHEIGLSIVYGIGPESYESKSGIREDPTKIPSWRCIKSRGLEICQASRQFEHLLMALPAQDGSGDILQMCISMCLTSPLVKPGGSGCNASRPLIIRDAALIINYQVYLPATKFPCRLCEVYRCRSCVVCLTTPAATAFHRWSLWRQPPPCTGNPQGRKRTQKNRL